MTPVLQHLALGRSTVDRAAHLRQDAAWWSDVSGDPASKVLCVRQGAVAFDGSELVFVSPAQVPQGELAFLGAENGENFLVWLHDVPEDHQLGVTLPWESLRNCGVQLSDRDAGLATTAVALVNWHRNHTHCPRCGENTFITNAGWVRQCPSDGSEHYPRTDSAVIIAITDESDRLLLARQKVWQPGHFSIVAGFVEPGETFEAAAIREANEEIGLDVVDVEYLGSQPWPFPASLMVGCRARATTTDIAVDGEEIEEAAWFSRDELIAACESGDLRLPSKVSIARRIIENWYGAELPHEWSRP